MPTDDKPSADATGPPSFVVFEVTTARRVGAQLRYNGGHRLNEVRRAAWMLTVQEPPLASDY
ncbi:hypothetical protein ACH4OY_30715 [Micromonospora rubida]|uniref:Uncharacterized protein n=1 Tax=Micromonospora rubida TaxID=2697657 RepID=A0ABW7SVR0_9ACTN